MPSFHFDTPPSVERIPFQTTGLVLDSDDVSRSGVSLPTRSHHHRCDEIPYLGRLASHVFWKCLERNGTCRCQRWHIAINISRTVVPAFASYSNVISSWIFCQSTNFSLVLGLCRRELLLPCGYTESSMYQTLRNTPALWLANVLVNLHVDSHSSSTFFVDRHPFGTSNPTKESAE